MSLSATEPQKRSPFVWRDALIAFLIACCALALFSYQNDFRIGLHANEKAKIVEAIGGNYYFAHPLFLVRATRLFVLLTHTTTEYGVAFWGRMVSAIMATVGVVAFFALARRTLGTLLAAMIALTITASPLLAIHAHYIKEDASLFGCFALASIAFSRLFSEINRRSVIWAGITLGAAISCKLVGSSLLLIYIMTVFCQPKSVRGPLFKTLITIVPVALLVFVLINLPAFFDLTAMIADQKVEIAHVLEGQFFSVYHPLDFYITYTFLPDLGLLFCLLVLAGMGGAVFLWRKTLPFERFLFIATVLYFSMITVTPYKNWPDYERMALPLLFPMAYFAGYGLKQAMLAAEVHSGRYGKNLAALIPLTLLFSIVPIGWDSLQILHEFKNDTRTAIAKMIGNRQYTTFTEHRTILTGQDVSSAFCYSSTKKVKKAQILITSSFLGDQIRYGSTHGGEKNVMAQFLNNEYEKLKETPYCELRPSYRSYAYSNPSLRVFSMLAINSGMKADPATNGQPCTAEFIAQLPSVPEYTPEQMWSPLSAEEDELLCKKYKPLFADDVIAAHNKRQELPAN